MTESAARRGTGLRRRCAYHRDLRGWLLQKHVPGIRVRVVNVVDLDALRFRRTTPWYGHMLVRSALHRKAPVMFAFHNNRWVIHTMVHGRSNEGRFHVHGYH